MRAYFNARGLTAIIDPADVEKRHLECKINQYNKPKLVIDIVSSVYGTLDNERKGFHISYTPSLFLTDTIFQSKEITIKISERNWENFIPGKFDFSGYFSSTSKENLFVMRYLFNPKERPENIISMQRMYKSSDKPFNYKDDHEYEFLSRLLDI